LRVVDVWMVNQGLGPGEKHSGKSDPCPKAFGIDGDLGQSGRHRLEE